MSAPEFTATTTHHFLKEWGVHHCLSSVAFPYANLCAEVGVKTVKRLITDNTDAHGSLHTLQRIILQYQNTPDPNTQLSSEQNVFGRLHNHIAWLLQTTSNLEMTPLPTGSRPYESHT